MFIKLKMSLFGESIKTHTPMHFSMRHQICLLLNFFISQILLLGPYFADGAGLGFKWCPNKWTYYPPTNKCFGFFPQKITQPDAQAKCKAAVFPKNFTGIMAEFRSTDEISFMCQMAKGYYFWLPILDADKNGVHHMMYNPLEVLDPKTLNWAKGEPNSAVETCIVAGASACEFHDNRCTFKHSYVCEIKGVNSCVKKNGGCKQICVPAGLGNNTCSCNGGFVMKGTVCQDMYSCEYNNGNCTQLCEAQNNGTLIVCKCRKGFVMKDKKCITDVKGGSSIIPMVVGGTLITGLVGGLGAFFKMRKKPSAEKVSDADEQAGTKDSPEDGNEEAEEGGGEEEEEEEGVENKDEEDPAASQSQRTPDDGNDTIVDPPGSGQGD